MVYNKRIILSAITLFFVSSVIFLSITACEGIFPVPEPITYTITASTGNNGSIDPEGKIIVSEGEDQVFTIIPDEGYEISDVLVDDISVGVLSEYTFKDVKQDHNVQVSFLKKPQPALPATTKKYIITATSGTGGTIEPDGEISVLKGKSQTFTIIPDICYQIEKIIINETEDVEAESSYTIDDIQEDYKIEVSFALSDKKIRRYNQDGELQNDNYTSIHAAINDLDTTDGDSIIVCPGTYYENLTFDGSRKITLQSVDPEDEDTKSSTIIDGGEQGSVVTFINSDESTLQGFTITNGSGTSTGTFTAGGGIYLDSSSPNILHNIIEDNASANGGGIFIAGDSFPEIEKNIIRANESTNMAGGIYIFRGSANITNNTISGNLTNIYGGGIYVYEGYEESLNNIANNFIKNNQANDGGGIYLSQTSPVIASNDIRNNTANIDGGGIYLNNSSSNITNNNTITENSAGQNGGGIYMVNSYSAGENNICGNSIESNTADSAGGGFYINNSIPSINGNNNISENEAQWGGGIFIVSSSPIINENSIIANYAIGGSGSGGGIYINNSSPNISSNTINLNTAVINGGGMNVSSNSILLPDTARPVGWGSSGEDDYRKNIPPDDLDDNDKIAGNYFSGNLHQIDGDTGGAHVYFQP